jgi:adenylate kinase family enzyme
VESVIVGLTVDLTSKDQTRIHVVERVAVVGSPGSGKSTVAEALSVGLGLPHLELDSVFHQPGWQGLPADEFRGVVRAFTDRPAWVVDGNYTRQGISDLVWPRADTVVWLDLPRWETMRRVGARTLRRILRSEELWNGNRERWIGVVDPRPEHNILLWTWIRYDRVKGEYGERFEDPKWSPLRLIRLQSQRAIDEFVANIPRDPHD